MVDLSHVPFVDGHMHPPLRVRPQTVEEYRWPWFEGLPSESAHVTELVPYRWAIRQLADELGCAADERTVVRATRELDPTTWLATVCERSQTVVSCWTRAIRRRLRACGRRRSAQQASRSLRCCDWRRWRAT